jgi:hypothetical protein
LFQKLGGVQSHDYDNGKDGDDCDDDEEFDEGEGLAGIAGHVFLF